MKEAFNLKKFLDRKLKPLTFISYYLVDDVSETRVSLSIYSSVGGNLSDDDFGKVVEVMNDVEVALKRSIFWTIQPAEGVSFMSVVRRFTCQKDQKFR